MEGRRREERGAQKRRERAGGVSFFCHMLGSCGCWVTGWPGDRVPVSWGVGVSRRSPQCIRELQLFVLLLLCFPTSNSLPPCPSPDFDKNPISRCHQLGMASAHLPKGCAVKIHLTLFPLLPPGPPAPPQDITIQAGATPGTVQISWKPPPLTATGLSNGANVTGYGVYAKGQRVSFC